MRNAVGSFIFDERDWRIAGQQTTTEFRRVAAEALRIDSQARVRANVADPATIPRLPDQYS